MKTTVNGVPVGNAAYHLAMGSEVIIEDRYVARPKTYGGGMVKMDLMAGFKDLLEPAKRFSRKTLEQIARDVKRLSEQDETALPTFGGLNVYNRLVNAVCQKDGLVLVDPIPAPLPTE